MYLNEQLLDLTAAAVFFVLAVILLAVLQWRGARQIERREEALRLAGVALVNSLEHLLAQNARDIERKAQPTPKHVLASRLVGPLPPGFTLPPEFTFEPDPLAEFASECDIHGAASAKFGAPRELDYTLGLVCGALLGSASEVFR